jgi:hypothetical protein
MRRKSQLFAVAILGLSIATSAMALNPQPLPPGRYLPAGAMVHTEHGGLGLYRPMPRCHSVQVGDPRKQPPMLVCP